MQRHLVLAAVTIAASMILGARAPLAHVDAEANRAEIALPSGFRDWVHVKRGSSAPDAHDIYANALAQQGYANGVFPDGAVLVFNVVASDVPPSTPGAASVRTDVMVRDAVAYAATGGWGYASFPLGDPARSSFPQSQARTVCHTCHERDAAPDFVFTAS